MNKIKTFVSTLMLVAIIIIGLAASLMFRVGSVSAFTIIISVLGGLKTGDFIIAFSKWMSAPSTPRTGSNVPTQATVPATKTAPKKPTASAAAKDNSQF